MPRPVGLRQADARLLFRGSVDLLRVDHALRHRNLRDITAEIERERPRDATFVSDTDILRARRYSRRIAMAARVILPRAQCLHRSLVLHRWLRAEGLPSELRIGVLKDGQQLKAHAWVELVGAVVNDRRSATHAFAPLQPQGITATNHDTRSMEWS